MTGQPHLLWPLTTMTTMLICMTASIAPTSAQKQKPIPDWVVFPEEDWETIAPEEAGLDVEKWNAWVARQKPSGHSSWGQNPQHKYGVVITRGGYLLKTFGDPDFKVNSASVGKAFTSLALQLAIDEGLIKNVDEPICKYWTGKGELIPEAKQMDQGFHASLTFYHLHAMKGGFPISNGWHWSNRQDVPNWAAWTSDPTADNYAHIRPGIQRHYSSGGRWRLSQALTAVWKRELKDVLGEKLFRYMGIKAKDWEWDTGRELHDNRKWYPGMPGYGLFCDPPYEIDGHRVQGGGGWVTMSAKDLARVGLLVATRGVWKDQRLINDTSLVQGHAGGNACLMDGWRDTMFSWGQVTTRGVSPQGLEETIRWLIGKLSSSRSIFQNL
ncbi:MAG: serine hydrolase [Candidatus Poribacteria bacterium]|nr:serine hydrolase [Candidatus Poribacteria bacterium]